MEIKDNVVKISLPKTSIFFINYKDYTEDSIYTNKDSWINNNKITDDEKNEAFADANKKMIDNANNNQKLFDEAQNILEVLMKNYINRIGELSGIDYIVEFIYIES